jgi:hypothetical protein
MLILFMQSEMQLLKNRNVLIATTNQQAPAPQAFFSEFQVPSSCLLLLLLLLLSLRTRSPCSCSPCSCSPCSCSPCSCAGSCCCVRWVMPHPETNPKARLHDQMHKQRQLQHNPSCCWGASLGRACPLGAGKCCRQVVHPAGGGKICRNRPSEAHFVHRKYKKTVPASSSERVFLAALVPCAWPLASSQRGV